jgi:hypothetical protein
LDNSFDELFHYRQTNVLICRTAHNVSCNVQKWHRISRDKSFHCRGRKISSSQFWCGHVASCATQQFEYQDGALVYSGSLCFPTASDVPIETVAFLLNQPASCLWSIVFSLSESFGKYTSPDFAANAVKAFNLMNDVCKVLPVISPLLQKRLECPMAATPESFVFGRHYIGLGMTLKSASRVRPPGFDPGPAARHLSSFHTSCSVGCVWGFWWFPAYKLHANSSNCLELRPKPVPGKGWCRPHIYMFFNTFRSKFCVFFLLYCICGEVCHVAARCTHQECLAPIGNLHVRSTDPLYAPQQHMLFWDICEYIHLQPKHRHHLASTPARGSFMPQPVR